MAAKKPKPTKAEKYIQQIVTNAGNEANSYPELKELLCDPSGGIALPRHLVLVDTTLQSGGRPDIQIWLDVDVGLRNENEHLFGVIEVKPKTQVRDKGDAIAEEKFAIYRRARLRHFWLLDAEVVRRYDLSAGALAFRKVSLCPTAAPHPDNTYITNTSWIVQLDSDLPLHIYLLGRIPRWFLLKTGRTSVVQGFYSTWVPRTLLRTPVPASLSANDRQKIIDIGNSLFQLDVEIEAGYSVLAQYESVDGTHAVPLRRSPLLASGAVKLPDEKGWPSLPAIAPITGIEEGETIRLVTHVDGGLFPYLDVKTDSGTPCVIAVKDPDLRAWLLWAIRTRIDSGADITLNWARNVPVPNEPAAALKQLKRVIDGEAAKDLESHLDLLDDLTVRLLGLPEELQTYVKDDLQCDPILRFIHPAWRHTRLRDTGV